MREYLPFLQNVGKKRMRKREKKEREIKYNFLQLMLNKEQDHKHLVIYKKSSLIEDFRF